MPRSISTFLACAIYTANFGQELLMDAICVNTNLTLFQALALPMYKKVPDTSQVGVNYLF